VLRYTYNAIRYQFSQIALQRKMGSMQPFCVTRKIFKFFSFSAYKNTKKPSAELAAKSERR